MKKILILNTGGTFNKEYNEITGTLDVPENSSSIEEIIFKSFKNNLNIEVKGFIFKDSLDLKKEDRKKILNEVKKYEKVVIVHGTDTIDITAKFLSKKLKDKKIVLTGSMMPFSIDKVEATSNLVQAISFLKFCKKDGIYISMHGLIDNYKKIEKNREIGKFECRK